MTLYQHFALEGVALHRIGAGVEQIGVAAEDLAVPEKNHAAALARTSVEQADVDRIQPVFHRLPDATVPGRGALLPFCQTRCHGVNAPVRSWCRAAAFGFEFVYAYFLSRSSSSTEMPCGPRMKQMRTPGRMVVGSLVNSTPLALISAATASMSFTVKPKWSSP